MYNTIMVMRSVHYEQAFEHYLRSNGVPYVGVDEARRTVMDGRFAGDSQSSDMVPLKSFDFVVYTTGENLLLDVKGRKCADRGGRGRSQLQTWVTDSDVESLTVWQGLFGAGYCASFVFVYWCESQPPDGLFEEVFEFKGRWYVMRLVAVDRYAQFMRRRSIRWSTLSVRAADFVRIAQPCDLHRSGSAARASLRAG